MEKAFFGNSNAYEFTGNEKYAIAKADMAIFANIDIFFII